MQTGYNGPKIQFIPKAVAEGRMSGAVFIRPLDFDEVCALADLNQELVIEGAEGGVEQKPRARSGYQIIREMVKGTRQCVLSVDLTKPNGTRIETYEAMTFDRDCHEVLTELALALVKNDLGNG